MIPINQQGGNPWGSSTSPYLEMGGDIAVKTLVEAFYDIIEEESPELRSMLPANTATSREKLYEFLSGWLGGPPLYEEKRGHPRLRMRHLPFPIGKEQAEEWMRCFRLAMTRTGTSQQVQDYLDSRLAPLAEHMVNR